MSLGRGRNLPAFFWWDSGGFPGCRPLNPRNSTTVNPRPLVIVDPSLDWTSPPRSLPAQGLPGQALSDAERGKHREVFPCEHRLKSPRSSLSR